LHENKQRISGNHNCPNQARHKAIMLRMTIKALVAWRLIVRIISKISLIENNV
jgi:hypothetical protein